MPRHELSSFEKNIRQLIAQNLKTASRGMTQGDLAAKTGIPSSTLSGYFAQRSTPSPENVQLLADVLGVHRAAIDPRFSDTLFTQDAAFDVAYLQLTPSRQLAVRLFAQEQLKQQNQD
ncbi:helix-turn-helix domain-containing protein [Levilactobacillus fujinensis]|uniref:Helix-turn-helix domain-containing protein n=1 Tax=Levilactobacillus fujinensis TaxID=2486024 RepID=A0ABW1TFI6_9LACO|nr:helix-turn-helix transcriptional regulator [Levilactobacillus fujinensis]